MARTLNNSFSVTGVDFLGNESAKSTPQSFYIDAYPPGIPYGLSISGMTTSSVVLSWNATTDNSGIAPTYRVYKYSTLVGTTSGTSLTINMLNDNDVFPTYVTAIDAVGNESNPPPYINVTIDVTPPTTPTNLIFAGKSFSSLNLTWTPSIDTHLKGYYIYKNGMLLNTNNPWTGNTYNVSGGNDLYGSYYYVKATDINNNISLQSNTVTSSPTILVVDTLRRSVGIGRDIPLERLHVDGNARLGWNKEYSNRQRY